MGGDVTRFESAVCWSQVRCSLDLLAVHNSMMSFLLRDWNTACAINILQKAIKNRAKLAVRISQRKTKGLKKGIQAQHSVRASVAWEPQP